jgi:hypothetical protein
MVSEPQAQAGSLEAQEQRCSENFCAVRADQKPPFFKWERRLLLS